MAMLQRRHLAHEALQSLTRVGLANEHSRLHLWVFVAMEGMPSASRFVPEALNAP